MSTFFCLFPFAKKLYTQTVSTEKLRKTLSYEKASLKMLVKLTPVGRKKKCLPMDLNVQVFQSLVYHVGASF